MAFKIKNMVLALTFLFFGLSDSKALCIDTCKYVLHNITGLNTTFSIGSSDGASDWCGVAQGYYYSGPGKIYGISSIVRVDQDNVDNSSPAVTAIIKLFKFGAGNLPDTTQILASDTISVQDLGGNYQYFAFKSPIDLNNNFFISLELPNLSQSKIYPVKSTDGNGKLKDLASIRYPGYGWYNERTDGTLQDIDYILLPVMEHTFTAGFSSNTIKNCFGDSVIFTNTSIVNADSMFNKGLFLSLTETYYWNFGDGATSNNVNNNHLFMQPGNYSVQLIDSFIGWNSICAKLTSLTVSVFKIDVNSTKKDVSCFGKSDGEVTSVATGGTPPYGYKWNNIPIQTLPARPAGIYYLEASDANGCKAYDTLVITQPEILNIEFVVKNESVSSSSDGSINSNISGGTPPFSYLWSNMQTTGSISNISAGTYFLTVTDTNGCFLKDTAIVSVGTSIKRVVPVLEDILIYPNPSMENITIIIKDQLEPATFELFDLQGKSILFLNLTQIHISHVSLKGISEGIYAAKISTGKLYKFKRIVIIK